MPSSHMHEVYSVVAFVLPDTQPMTTTPSGSRVSALGISTATSGATTAQSVTSTPGAAIGASYIPSSNLMSSIAGGREGSIVSKLLPGAREASVLSGGSGRQLSMALREQQERERQPPATEPASSQTPRVMRIKMFILRTSSSHTVPLASPRAPTPVGELDIDSDIRGAMGELGEAAAKRLREVVVSAAMHRRRDDIWFKLTKLPQFSTTGNITRMITPHLDTYSSMPPLCRAARGIDYYTRVRSLSPHAHGPLAGDRRCGSIFANLLHNGYTLVHSVQVPGRAVSGTFARTHNHTMSASVPLICLP